MNNEEIVDRNLELPLFDPYAKSFICDKPVTDEFDAEANDWYQRGISLESLELFSSDRDYPSILSLTQAAADRGHWKAMLNLASLYVEGQSPGHGEPEAVQLVERAMQVGSPAAFDRMGTYYLNGTGVRADTKRAYAFFQRAAQMGNPEAMFFLGEKLDVGPEYESRFTWSNIPTAWKLYECAFRQGYGPAAYQLYYAYVSPTSADGSVIGRPTSQTRLRALKILHEGVKLGCLECARTLFAEFGRSLEGLVLVRDKARSERYHMLTLALDFNPRRRFPNLDKVLPLPPAELPPWDGDRFSLIEAAKGVRPKPTPIEITLPRKERGRYFVNPAYSLVRTIETTKESVAPFAGYWKPIAPDAPSLQAELAKLQPGLYGVNEPFDQVVPIANRSRSDAAKIVWERWKTVRNTGDAIELFAADDAVRNIDRVVYRANGVKAQTCPTTGTWQPWVRADHPMAPVVNQFWRQAWVKKGQAFPDPAEDWLLELASNELEWHLMESEADAKIAVGAATTSADEGMR